MTAPTREEAWGSEWPIEWCYPVWERATALLGWYDPPAIPDALRVQWMRELRLEPWL